MVKDPTFGQVVAVEAEMDSFFIYCRKKKNEVICDRD
jgi:hypothetical protein